MPDPVATDLEALHLRARTPIWWRLLRWLPNAMPGKGRLSRWSLPGRPVRVRLNCGHEVLAPDGNEPMVSFAAVFGNYEQATLQCIARWQSARGGSIVDVGANIGMLSLPLAARLSGDAQLLAIEGSPRVHAFLMHNVARSGLAHRIKVRNVLCGESDDRNVPFFDAPQRCFGMGSRAPQFQAEPTAHLPMRTLDSLLEDTRLQRVTVLKVDVEGYELEVFKGAARCLAQYRPLVVFEFNDWAEQRRGDVPVGAAQDFLLAAGFHLHLLQPDGGVAEALSAPIRSGSAMLVARPVG